MDNNYQHIAFLCGHFKRDKAVDHDQLERFGWIRQTLSPADARRGKRYYYPEFIDFCHAGREEEGCVRYTRPVDAMVTMMVDVRGQSRSYAFTVKELNLYLMPHQMVVYSIHVQQDAGSFDDCSALIYTLRYIDAYDTAAYKDFCRLAVEPIVRVYDALKSSPMQDPTMLVENGNKLRVFQIINAPAAALAGLTDDEKRHLQYELATFSTVSIEGKKAIDSPAEQWQTSNKKCRVAVFESWTALAMLDSFNILGTECDSQLGNWIDKYYGCIYIQALFQKVCLFDFNNRFKLALRLQGSKTATKRVNALVREYEAFERNCSFNRISYNFLPQLISDAINGSLEITDEMEQLYRIMAKERSRNDEINQKKMNSLLVGISFLTLFSAIWDACSMFNEMFSVESHFSSSYWGYRVMGFVMLVVVAGGLYLLYRFRQNR